VKIIFVESRFLPFSKDKQMDKEGLFYGLQDKTRRIVEALKDPGTERKIILQGFIESDLKIPQLLFN